MDDVLEIDITIQEILDEIKQGIWIIVYAIAVGILIGVFFTVYKERVATYKATSTIIMSKDEQLYIAEDQYTKNDIDLYVKSGNSYIEIAESNLVMDRTLAKLQKEDAWEKELTRDALQKMLKAGYKTETLIIELSGTSENRIMIEAVVNAYAQAFIEVANELLPVANLKVMDQAETPEKMIKSNLIRNIIIGSAIGVIGSLTLIIIMLLWKKNKITTEQEINDLLELNVLVTFE